MIKVVKSEVIGVDKEAYIYLEQIGRAERGCKPLTDDQIERVWRRCRKTADGLRELDNDSLGGGDGTYNGKWWSWSVATLRKMLTEGGYTWVELGERESRQVYM